MISTGLRRTYVAFHLTDKWLASPILQHSLINPSTSAIITHNAPCALRKPAECFNRHWQLLLESYDQTLGLRSTHRLHRFKLERVLISLQR
ncbi:hypothetical protein MTO96_022998 [Rhipicephalus appendiculatus]